jgi:hypothetical protein
MKRNCDFTTSASNADVQTASSILMEAIHATNSLVPGKCSDTLVPDLEHLHACPNVERVSKAHMGLEGIYGEWYRPDPVEVRTPDFVIHPCCCITYGSSFNTFGTMSHL